MKALGAVVGILWSFTTTSYALADTGDFNLHNGVISGQGAPTQVTLLVNSATGQTWFLAVIGDKVKWLPLPFSQPVPADTLPPSPK